MSAGLVELAERLAGPTVAPWLERVRFVASGSEATLTALRIARGATGRRRVLKFEVPSTAPTSRVSPTSSGAAAPARGRPIPAARAVPRPSAT